MYSGFARSSIDCARVRICRSAFSDAGSIQNCRTRTLKLPARPSESWGSSSWDLPPWARRFAAWLELTVPYAIASTCFAADSTSVPLKKSGFVPA